MKGRGLRTNVVLASFFMLVGGLLLLSSPFAYPLSAAETEAIRTVDLSFVLSLDNPSHNMSLESTTTEVEILRLESNDTPFQIVAYSIAGVFVQLSNVTSIQNLALHFYDSIPWNISFIRESANANVSVLARLHSATLAPLIVFGPYIILFGIGAVILGICIWWLYGLDRRQRLASDGGRPRHGRPAVVLVLMLLASLCFTPITVIYGIYGGVFGVEGGSWVGYENTMNVELNSSHPQEQVEVYRFGGCPVLLYIMNSSGRPALIRFQTGAATEQFIAARTSQGDGMFQVELQNDTVITLTRLDTDVSLLLWWISGALIPNRAPNWGLLLSPLVGPPVVFGLILMACGLDEAKRIDSQDRS